MFSGNSLRRQAVKLKREQFFLTTILKHVVWRFGIYNYFREIFKFRENLSKNRFCEISLSVHKIAKFEYFAKVVIYSRSPDNVL